ncbi:MAG: ABC transporter permease [Planctomycetes bacterium]|nr:ABC transporter permease [Planctomycetota bacterium]MCB9830544.1 ABC transporter permease [Planctomycetota bacterium]MCB9901312.1 ABC transporter permease [Planctomycetota bacterium]
MSGSQPAPAAPVMGRSLWSDAWRRLRRNRMALLGAVVLVLMALACGLLPAIFGLDPEATHLEVVNKAPLSQEGVGVFGTDGAGRSYVARVLVGGGYSLLVGLVATLVSVLIGTTVGAIAGYVGGRVDEVIMAFVDILYAIPYMFLVILVLIVVGEEYRGNPIPIFAALGMVQWLTMARIVRGQVLSLRNQEFVDAARALGASDARIIVRHILPNILGVVIVYATLTVPAVIILESFLSFLGLGLQLSWGALVSEGVKVVNPIESQWWLLFWPSLFLAVTLFSLNFLGDGLRDALDPKGRR